MARPLVSVAVRAAEAVSAAGTEPDEILRFLRIPPPAPLVTLPEAGIEIPMRLAAAPDWNDAARLPRMAANVLARALEAAGLDRAQRERAALLVASSSMNVGAYEASERTAGTLALADQRNALAESLAEKFGLGGLRFSLNAACASGAAALLYGHRLIRDGAVEHAVIVGAEGLNQLTPAGFAALRLLAPANCTPFASGRQGMVLGEGAAVVVLGRGDDARWLLEGGAMNCDPHSPTASTPEAMSGVMEAAFERVQLDRRELVAVKVHGSGSDDSDRAEARALADTFSSSLPPLAGFKPMLGHTLGASAVLELVALMQSADAGWLPPAIGGGNADPALPMGDDLPAPVPADGRYLLNTFGFGGNNAALIMKRRKPR